MKRSSHSWAIVFIFTFTAYHTSAQRFIGGLTAGVNLSQIDGDRLAGFHQPGLNAGARVAAVLGERWQLSVEMLYSQQGARRSRYDDPGAALDNIRLNYVEAPFMLHFKEWKLLASAGLSYARLINARVIDIFGEEVTDSQNLDPNQFLVVLSATYFFSDKWGLNVGWSRSMNNMKADPGAGKWIGRNIHIRGLYLF
jgi:hypothetical protein